jgi:hypothetical protein
VSALWNVDLCGRRLEGLQLMRHPLGRARVHPSVGKPSHWKRHREDSCANPDLL